MHRPSQPRRQPRHRVRSGSQWTRHCDRVTGGRQDFDRWRFHHGGGRGTGNVARKHLARLNADGTVDFNFDAEVDKSVDVLALQADGKILVGGRFYALGVAGGSVARSNIGRLTNIGAATQDLAVSSDGTTITWERGGTSPELSWASFDFSTDGIHFGSLGSAQRITGGWQLAALDLPQGQKLFIRARGHYSNASQSAIESTTETAIGAPPFTRVFSQIASGGNYRTTLTGINTGQAATDVSVALVKSDGTPFPAAASAAAKPLHLESMGTARLQVGAAGEVAAGYALFSSNSQVDGTALFQSLQGEKILSEAGVGLSKPARNFTVYIDNTDVAVSGYAVANTGNTPAALDLTLRDNRGMVVDHARISLPPKQHIAEFAYQRFPQTAPSGFEGSIEFKSDRYVAAVALRYDSVSQLVAPQVFSTIPVLVDEAATTLYFPQVADGAGYRTNFILVNPQDTAAVATLQFYRSDGTPLSLAFGGTPRTSIAVTLNARGVARLLTDGISGDLSVGWVKVSSSLAMLGSAIFQTREGGRIRSEAGVSSSPPMRHFSAYVESLGSAWSGVAICNPNAEAAAVTLTLRRANGEVASTKTITLPPGGHTAKFFTDAAWFPEATDFEGSLEVRSTQPVSAVALRYDNLLHDVFATLPVLILR